MDKKLSEKEAEATADKIRQLLAEPYVLKSTSATGKDSTVGHHCTASIGVVLFIGNELAPEEILKRSDDAMYLAKDAGRNRVRFHQINTVH
jgi:diguanylate cyclase (GGDEF)-like protein